MDLSRSRIIDRIQSRVMSIDEFNFDRLSAPPLYSLLTQQDIDRLYKIATSARYSGNATKRFQAIDDVMRPRGFVKLSSGTNRVCYKFLEDDKFVAKVAIDAVGIKDNPREFMNQHIFKPFVTKIFEVDPTGVVAIAERVIPVTSREEFESIADDVYNVITDWFIGKYIMADIGTHYFMNWACRRGFGPILLDFPYAYELDGNKLYCSEPNDNSPTGRCEGVIDYDDGFNFLICSRCGKRYRVQELAKAIKEENIILKGRRTKRMKVGMKVNGVMVTEAKETDGDLFKNATEKIERPVDVIPATGLKVSMKVTNKPVNKKSNDSVRSNNNKGKKNNNYTNNRGIVRASGNTTNVKASIVKSKESDPTPLKIVAEYITEYDKENELMIYSDNNGNKVVVPTSLIPVEYNDCIVENSSKADELALALASIESLENEKIDLNDQLLHRLDEIRELEAKIVDLEDKADDGLIEKLKKQIEELKNGTTESKDVTLLEEKNTEIEKLNVSIKDLEKTISDLTEQLESSMKAEDEWKNKFRIEAKSNEDYENKLQDKDAKLKALEDMLQNANNTIEELNNVGTEIVLPITDSTEEANIFDKYSKYSNISPISGLLTRISTVEKLGEGVEDVNVILFPDGDGGYLFDQDGKLLCLICVNGIEVNEFLSTDEQSIETIDEAPLGSIQQ